MKHLLVGVYLFINVSFAIAIQVSGEGRTFDEAKQNAFKTAIELSVGAIVTSERETKNYEQVKNEILVYSAGYVDTYKIISQNVSNKWVQLIVDVDVSSSKLKDFILTKPNNVREFEADKHQVQVDTYFDEREAGDQLVESLIKHYPYKAFNLTQLPYQFQVNVERNVTLVIPYEMSWNYKYLVALNETLKRVSDSASYFSKQAPGRIIIQSKSPELFSFGHTDVYQFNDLMMLNKIKQGFLGDKEVRLLLLVTNLQNQIVINKCIVPESLTGYRNSFYRKGTPDELVVFGNEVEKGVLRIELNQGQRINVASMRKITLSVVTNKDCQ